MSGEPTIARYIHRPSSSYDNSVQQAWHNYNCGHCEMKVTGIVVAAAYPKSDGPIRWLLCPNCREASEICNNGMILPSPRIGPSVQGLPNEIAAAYDETRSCFSIKAYTSCEFY